MAEHLILSVDAMGGDAAPEMVVEGVALATSSIANVKFMLHGDEQKIEPLLDRYPAAKRHSTVHHTSDVVKSSDRPAQALRGGRGSSMRLAINAVANGEADAVVSAGNTGALMAMARFVMKSLPGIDRPAIATTLPTQRGRTVMLDLGANVDCSADNLAQFAVMGEVFARVVLGVDKPSVGILNIGVEDLKGNEAVKAAAAILQQTHLPIKFYGFVEGDDIGAGTVDVVVTDGFTGNVALKTAEGTAKLFSSALKSALTSSVMSSMGALLAKPALNLLKRKFDPRRHNGAMFLGLNGICVKSHGGTDGMGFAHALQVAAELSTNAINESIKADYAQLSVDSEITEKAVANS